MHGLLIKYIKNVESRGQP